MKTEFETFWKQNQRINENSIWNLLKAKPKN